MSERKGDYLSTLNSKNGVCTGRKQLFISWSGETGKKAADIIYEWIDSIYEDVNEHVFLSTKIKPGRQGCFEIMDALNICKKGFFILTRERISSPWVHFEAGAISKANNLNSVIPILVDIKRESLGTGPLSVFQSNCAFNFDDLENLILSTGYEFGWIQRASYLDGRQAICNRFQKKITQFLEDVVPEPVLSELYQNCKNYTSCCIYENSGCLAHLDENTFFSIRKIAVESARGQLVIAGPSLTEAIGRGRTNNRSLRGALIDGISEKRITDIKLLLTDLSMFDSVCTESNEAISRVMASLNVLKNELFPICDEYMCDISVYFLPLHSVDHVVLTHKYMLYRSTKLWTSNGEYKGEFILYQNTGVQSEYSVQYSYLSKLMELCTKINLEIDTVSNYLDSYISKEIKEWRKSITHGCYSPYEGRSGELKYIHLYKLYDSQLTHYVACDWNGPDRSELRFVPSKQIKNRTDLFNSRNLLGDDTQRYLVDYIQKTEDLLRGVVEKYSTASVKGEKISDACIYPSLDLGFPNNSVRLAGGFATGMLVTWKCGTPIVPVDATVNVCSSSVFELPETYNINQTSEDFTKHIELIINDATKAGYAFNFASGNHFFMIAEDEEGKKYLVLHSSAQEFKDSYIGLYPVKGNWYSEKIRTYPSPYVHGERYIRYLKGDDAIFFISLAKKLEEMNVQIHKYFADKMDAKKCRLLEHSTYHHYYMPTESSIAIGTFVEEPGTIVPIFSAPRKEICLFEVDREQNWTIQLGGRPKCLIPHGWGQAISGRIDTAVDYIGQKFTITVNDHTYEHNLSEEKQIKCAEKRIREFTSCKEFFDKQCFIHGRIVKTLTPRFLYCDSIKGRVDE